MKRAKFVLFAFLIAVFVIAAFVVLLNRSASAVKASSAENQWEYLVVAGGTTNFSSPRELSLRKEPGPFSREAYPLEQNLDKLGAKGWELTAVVGNPADPTYYFKRRK